MYIDTWRFTLANSLQDLWGGVVAFLPNLVVAILIVVIGWAIGVLLARIISQLIKSLKIDDVLRRTGVDDVLRRGSISLNSGNFLGALVKWFVIVVFLVAAFEVLGLTQVNEFLQDVVLLYLPRVFVAVLVLLLAAVIADVMQKIVVTSAKTAEIRSAHFLGSVTKWAIWVFAFLIALSHLGIAALFVQTLFTGFIIALSLAFGLSFGLGGQDAAAKFLEKTRQEMTHRE